MVVRLSDDVLQESGVGFGRIGYRPIPWVRLLKVIPDLCRLPFWQEGSQAVGRELDSAVFGVFSQKACNVIVGKCVVGRHESYYHHSLRGT